MSEQDIESCDSCGASVYPEHLKSGKAGVVEGSLRCPHCVEEYNKTHHADEQRVVGQSSMKAPGEGEQLETVAIVEDNESRSSSQIRAISSDTLAGAADAVDDGKFSRPLNSEAFGATRCRTFHAKLNDGAVAYMNNQVNEWADAHADVTIKYATSTIGIWEGKKADPHLIVTIFY